MKFFNLDQHCAVIEDIANIFGSLGHQVDSVNFTGHNFVFGKPSIGEWNGFKPDFFWQYLEGGRFWREFSGHLSSYDGFISCYPPIFAWLFGPSNKPIIMTMPIRYEHFTSFNKGRWEEFNGWIKSASSSGQLHPVANSLYDAAYLKHFTGVDASYIPSLCDYMPHRWSNERSSSILMDTRSEGLDSHILSRVPNLLRLRSTYSRYEWSEIVKHRAFVHVPYNCSWMSFFEHYAMGVPLFVPTKDLLLDYRSDHKALSELTWNQSCGMQPPGSIIPPAIDDCLPDPNDYASEFSVNAWMPFYDCWHMPHVRQFRDEGHLSQMLSDDKLISETGEAMKEEFKTRKEKIIESWRDLLGKIQ